MPLIQNRSVRLGIATRIALWSWFLSLVTLIGFVLVILPQQKRLFLENLQSKANSVAVSLYDVSAGAAVNDDLASVVSACQTLLNGDSSIDFLIVTQNNGYALINQQTSWRVEPAIGEYWTPIKRQASSGIQTVPILNQRVFHYAQPFDYSGIEWGWIHVGLSLNTYDESVANLYHKTIILVSACLILSLLLSLIYARQMVRPVLSLRHIVEKIADGNLSIRANVDRADELGNLARSVNVMSDSLLRRDRILESIRYAAQNFLGNEKWEDVINDILRELGSAAGVSRVYIFENSVNDAGDVCTSQRYEWTVQGVTPQLANPDLQMVPFDNQDLADWRDKLSHNKMISEVVAEMKSGMRTMLEAQNIVSILVVPVFVNKKWWGFLGFDDCSNIRAWSDAEKDSLRAATEMLGAAISRQRIQEDLKEAKAHLELRVFERTQELEVQVAAKEEALSDLAKAQSSLMEASRAAGMAEVATGVLHNVGNVLNSVNVSSTLLIDQLQKSRMTSIAKVADLIQEHADRLPAFFSEDPRGRQIPAYLSSLAAVLGDEQQSMIKEAEALRERIDHIKEIVAMQQSYGRVAGVDETVSPESLMEDALKLNAGALERHKVAVKRQYQQTSPIVVDKHKILQILLNLINNAKYACSEMEGERTIILQVNNPAPGRIRFQVADTGIGIARENLTRIFQHGFTTRKSGHGFGLHSGALAAQELGGNLSVHSDGLYTGATFILDLPCNSGGAI